MNENQIHFARLCDKVTCKGQFTDVQRGHWNNYDISVFKFSPYFPKHGHWQQDSCNMA